MSTAPRGILGNDLQSLLGSPQMQGIAMGLLQASGPSPTPISFGQALGQGMQMGNQMQEQAYQRQLNQLMMELKMKDYERKMKKDEALQDYLTGAMGGFGEEQALINAGIMSGTMDAGDLLKYRQDKADRDKKTKEERLKGEQAITQSMQSIRQVGEMATHKGMSDLVGAKNPFSGAITAYLPFTSQDELGNSLPVPGTDAAAFKARFDQLKGRQFLEAFETLKGGGHITEIEGKKATDAQSRMQLASTEEEFIEAAKEFQDVLLVGAQRAAEKYGLALPQVDYGGLNRGQDIGTRGTRSSGGVKFLGYEE